jgi:hypothetical protein
MLVGFMPQTECATCEALRERADRAVMHHIRLDGKLEIAKLSYDSGQIAQLGPVVKAAETERDNAVAEYVAHHRLHEQADGRS